MIDSVPGELFFEASSTIESIPVEEEGGSSHCTAECHKLSKYKCNKKPVFYNSKNLSSFKFQSC